VRRGVAGRRQVPLNHRAVELADDHRVRLEIVVVHATGLYDEQVGPRHPPGTFPAVHAPRLYRTSSACRSLTWRRIESTVGFTLWPPSAGSSAAGASRHPAPSRVIVQGGDLGVQRAVPV